MSDFKLPTIPLEMKHKDRVIMYSTPSGSSVFYKMFLDAAITGTGVSVDGKAIDSKDIWLNNDHKSNVQG